MTAHKILVACGALALCLGATACKKEEKKAEEPATGDPAATAAQPTPEPAPPPEPPKTLTAEEKVKLYQDCIGAFNAKDWEKVKGCYSDDAEAEFVDTMETVKGPEAIAKGSKEFSDAFPDLKSQPQLILQNGDKVAAILLLTGTHEKPLVGPDGEIPATNKKIGLFTFHMIQLAADKPVIKKEWYVYDQSSFMGQLGLHKAPHRPATTEGAAQPTVVLGNPEGATEKANLEAHRKSHELFEKRDIKGHLDIWADNAKIIDTAMPGDFTKKKAEGFLKGLFAGFPDAKSEPIDTWAAGDYVLVMQKNSGTNTGPMPAMGLKKPTGKAMSFTGVYVTRFENGKAVEGWDFYNGMAIALQLGLLGPPPSDKDEPGKGAAKTTEGG